MKFFPLILSSLRRKKARTLLTMLSITVAFLLFGYLAAIRIGFSSGVEVAGADRLIVRHRVSLAQLLPISYLDKMKQVGTVTAVIHQTWFGGIYREPKNFFAQMPVEQESFLDMYPEFLLPEEQKEAWLRNRPSAIVGRSLANRFGFKVGDRIPIQSTIWTKKDGSRNWEFEVAGIFDGKEKGTDTSGLYFRYDYFDESRAFGQGLVGWYVVRVKDPEESAQTASQIDDLFMNSSNETKAETEKAFLQGFAKQVGDIGSMIIAILSAVFFTILLVAGNTMGQAVRERTEEIGAMKAIGFTNLQVLGLILAESCLLSVLGGAIGLGIAAWMISAGDPTQGALPVFYFPEKDMVVGALLTVVLGVAAGLFPALQAMRLQIAEALRRMG